MHCVLATKQRDGMSLHFGGASCIASPLAVLTGDSVSSLTSQFRAVVVLGLLVASPVATAYIPSLNYFPSKPSLSFLGW